MKHLIEGLLTHEVVAVANSNRGNIQKWVDSGFVSAVARRGKHRRFSAANTVEAVLMTELNAIGLKPSVVTRLLHPARIAQMVEFVDEHAVEHGGQIAIFEPFPWVLGLDGSRCLDLGVKVAIDPTALLPLTLIIRCDQLLSGALNRALAVRKAREARAQGPH